MPALRMLNSLEAGLAGGHVGKSSILQAGSSFSEGIKIISVAQKCPVVQYSDRSGRTATNDHVQIYST